MAGRGRCVLLIMVAGLTPSVLAQDDQGDSVAKRPGPAEVLSTDQHGLERRLEAVEGLYRELLRRETESRQATERRYVDLERKYEAIQEQLARTLVTNSQIPVTPIAPAPSASHPPFNSDRRKSVDGDKTEEPWLPVEAGFEDGFVLQTLDEELSLRFHVLDQTDLKIFSPGDQRPARSGLYIPRVRLYFEGRLSRPLEYEVSLQRSVEGVWDLLDGNLNVRPNDRFQVRFGRQLVPYSYAWYDHLEQYFIVPERALFPLNFGLSRSAGLVAHGRLGEERLEYAIGGFDGRLQGVADNNTIRDAVGYVNARPFLRSTALPWLRFLNIGASGFLGQQGVPSEMLPLRTSVQSSENDEAARAASAIFLNFDEDVAGLGGRSGGATHLAWYGGPFSIEAEAQLARFGYAKHRENGLQQTSVPVAGGHVTLGYFMTGERVTSRTTVVPLRPFRLISGKAGPGAVELYARYSQIHLGQSVFQDDLADERFWTRDVYMTDIGFNWYLNRFVKLYFDWQHTAFGSPVLINPQQGRYSRQNDLFWIRCQVYY